MPFETATQLLEELIGISVRPRSVWYWVQNVGQRLIEALKSQLDTFEQGKPMPLDSIDPTIEQLPMLIGADGVMVPSTGFGSPYLRLGPIKLFADGSVGARTVTLFAPYQDAPS